MGKKLTEKELWVLRKFFFEKDSLPDGKQESIAQKFAKDLKTRFKIEQEIGDPLLFLKTVYRENLDEE